MARVRVCLPVRQGERHLSEAISSVLAQTRDDWELVVSDNASTDRSAEIARGFASDPRVRVLDQETDLGMVGNLEACRRGAEAEWLLFLPHDDRLHPDALDRLLAAAGTGVAAVVGGVRFIDPDGRDRSGWLPPEGVGDLGAWSLAHALNPAHWAATLWRRRALEEAGGPRAEAGLFFDWALFLSVALRGSTPALPSAVADVREHGDSLTSRLGSPARHGMELVRALRDFAARHPERAEAAEAACRILARRYAGRGGDPGTSFLKEAGLWWAAPFPWSVRLGCILRAFRSRFAPSPAAAPPPPAPPSAPS